ncbi:hypothetical protein [Capnocytophaga canis]|uniref:hypothetical protein n=1 Tax=Capnocytophaga canis TaxID=1848903 RepID=UPI001562740B|nr:hypothetical protein [Capnocytophaga canis]
MIKKVPQGDLLRQYLLKSSINQNLLFTLLKNRGVLLKSKKKETILPYYLKTIVDAEIFDEIQMKDSIKEKRPKFTNASIKLKEDFEVEKLTELKLDLYSDLLEKKEFKPNYSFKNEPQFYVDFREDKQKKISLDIEIAIENPLENFGSTQVDRTAKIDIIQEGNSLIINKNYTSPETKEIIDFVVGEIRTYLKQEDYINKEDDFIAIRFNDFNNENRVEFLKSFKFLADKVKYESILDIDIECKEKYDKIDKLLENISNMKIKGDLETHPFLIDKEYYSKIILHCIKIKYGFDLGLEKGEFILELSFPEFDSESEEENHSNPIFQFSINVTNCNNKDNINRITNELALLVEKYKNEVYNSIIVSNRKN